MLNTNINNNNNASTDNNRISNIARMWADRETSTARRAPTVLRVRDSRIQAYTWARSR